MLDISVCAEITDIARGSSECQTSGNTIRGRASGPASRRDKACRSHRPVGVDRGRRRRVLVVVGAPASAGDVARLRRGRLRQGRPHATGVADIGERRARRRCRGGRAAVHPGRRGRSGGARSDGEATGTGGAATGQSATGRQTDRDRPIGGQSGGRRRDVGPDRHRPGARRGAIAVGRRLEANRRSVARRAFVRAGESGRHAGGSGPDEGADGPGG